MTTTVIINAHLSSEKEVRVTMNDNITGLEIERFSLQDGESASRVVFDGREISIQEITKV